MRPETRSAFDIARGRDLSEPITPCTALCACARDTARPPPVWPVSTEKLATEPLSGSAILPLAAFLGVIIELKVLPRAVTGASGSSSERMSA